MATVAPSDRSTTLTAPSATAGPFNIDFRLFDDDTLKVYVNGVFTADWTLTATFVDGYCDDATITFDSALADGDEVVIDGYLTPRREADYVAGQQNLTAALNNELARLWATVAELKRDTERSVRGFDAIEPATDIDTDAIANAGANATAAAASAAAASASAAAAQAAENSLLEWAGPWLTATAYAPSDIVQESGNAYVCVVAHTSGTFATDLAANKWELFAQKGASGAGTGDVLAANNGSDFASATTFRQNLNIAGRFGPTVSADYDADYNTRESSIFGLSTGNTNVPTGAAAGDGVIWHRIDSDTINALWVLADGTPVTRTRRAGTWGSYVPIATEAYVDAARPVMIVRDQKASGTDGGTFNSGSYQTRTLNTTAVNNIAGASLTANQVTLPAGTYRVRAYAVAYGVAGHRIQLYDVTAGAAIATGLNASSDGNYPANVPATLDTEFTIGVTSAIELRHRCNVSKATFGFGRFLGYGDAEVYAQVVFEKRY